MDRCTPRKAKLMNERTAIEQAVEVLRTEAEGILGLIDRLDDDFDRMTDLIFHSTGRVIVSGIGKSGIVGRKIVATLNSTGTRSLFLHPVEAMHGDLGMVGPDDVFLALSNSGETDELNLLVPSIRSIGCTVIAFTGNRDSTLAAHSTSGHRCGGRQGGLPTGTCPHGQHDGHAGHGRRPGRGADQQAAFQSQRFPQDPSRRQARAAAVLQCPGFHADRRQHPPGAGTYPHDRWPFGKSTGTGSG